MTYEILTSAMTPSLLNVLTESQCVDVQRLGSKITQKEVVDTVLTTEEYDKGSFRLVDNRVYPVILVFYLRRGQSVLVTKILG